MTDLDQRADRVRQIAELLHGRVLARDGDVMHVEVPADNLGGAFGLFGMGGFRALVKGQQTTRMAPRRLVTMGNQVVVCDEMVTTVFMPMVITLTSRHIAIDHSGHGAAPAITRQTGPKPQ